MSLIDEIREALAGVEENLRLIHEAAGPVPRTAPMPRLCTFAAWEAVTKALATLERYEVVDEFEIAATGSAILLVEKET